MKKLKKRLYRTYLGTCIIYGLSLLIASIESGRSIISILQHLSVYDMVYVSMGLMVCVYRSLQFFKIKGKMVYVKPIAKDSYVNLVDHHLVEADCKLPPH